MKMLAWMFWTVWGSHLIPMFFGLGAGPSSQQTKEQGVLSGIGDFGVSKGENATNQATDFWSAIASGDHDAIMRVLGPQISNIKGQGQQIKQTASQFGNRSGGTNATLQRVDDSTRTQVNNLISNLTGSSVQNLGSEGANLLNLGERSSVDSFSAATTIQKENAAKWQDIFNSLAEVVGSVASLPQLNPGGIPSTTSKTLSSIGGIFQ